MKPFRLPAAFRFRLALVALMAAICSVHAQDASTGVRQHFVPAAPDAAKGNGASFSALHHMPADAPGVLMLMAHAGIGDSFPVQEEHGPKLFEVAVVSGNDDILKIEVRRAEGVLKYDLIRDVPLAFEVGGHKFSLAYPSVTVGPAGPVASHQAMLIVNRFND